MKKFKLSKKVVSSLVAGVAGITLAVLAHFGAVTDEQAENIQNVVDDNAVIIYDLGCGIAADYVDCAAE